MEEKNIWVLPTKKPSRLWINTITNKLELSQDSDVYGAINIYITSDEEIKEGDWTLMFDDFGNLFLCNEPQQYLGVEKGHHLNKGLRKIILTTDQDLIADSVQAIDDEFLEFFIKNPSCEEVEVKSKDFSYDKEYWYTNYKIIIPKEEPKQETLEDANWKVIGTKNDTFYNGAKWQEERMYSEEEVQLILSKLLTDIKNGNAGNSVEWFEQFKKKGGDK